MEQPASYPRRLAVGDGGTAKLVPEQCTVTATARSRRTANVRSVRS